MNDYRTKYGPGKRPINIALNGLADDAYQQSDAINNLEDGFIDDLVQVFVKVTAGAPAGDKDCLVFAYGSAQGGAPHSGGATGKNSSFGGQPGQLIDNCQLLGKVTLDAANELFASDVFSIAAAFGGAVPEDWGIIVMNQSGRALADDSCIAFYQGVFTSE